MQLGLNSYSAEDVINKLNQKELEKIFKFFGDEKEGKYIARNIIKERVIKKIDTQGLVKIFSSFRIINYFNKTLGINFFINSFFNNVSCYIFSFFFIPKKFKNLIDIEKFGEKF